MMRYCDKGGDKKIQMIRCPGMWIPSRGIHKRLNEITRHIQMGIINKWNVMCSTDARGMVFIANNAQAAWADDGGAG